MLHHPHRGHAGVGQCRDGRVPETQTADHDLQVRLHERREGEVRELLLRDRDLPALPEIADVHEGEHVFGNADRSTAFFVDATQMAITSRFNIPLREAAYRTYMVAVDIPRGYVPHGLYWDTADPYHYVRSHTVIIDGHEQTVLIVGGEDHKTGQAEDGERRYAAVDRGADHPHRDAAVLGLEGGGQRRAVVRGHGARLLVADLRDRAGGAGAGRGRAGAALDGDRITTLINTHWHPAQTGSNEAVGRAGGVIVAHERRRIIHVAVTEHPTAPWTPRSSSKLSKR